MSKKLGGILAAVSTSFTADGGVDEGTLRRHVDFLIDNGMHGLVPGGSTGEFAALSSEERKFVNKVVIDQAALPAIPGTPEVGHFVTVVVTPAVTETMFEYQHQVTGNPSLQPLYGVHTCFPVSAVGKVSMVHPFTLAN